MIWLLHAPHWTNRVRIQLLKTAMSSSASSFLTDPGGCGGWGGSVVLCQVTNAKDVRTQSKVNRLNKFHCLYGIALLKQNIFIFMTHTKKPTTKTKKQTHPHSKKLQPFPAVTGNLQQSQVRQLILIMKALHFYNKGQGKCKYCYKITQALLLYYVNNLGVVGVICRLKFSLAHNPW